MIVDLFCSASNFDEEKYNNGLNINFHFYDGTDTVEINLVDDSEEKITSFNIRCEEIKKFMEVFSLFVGEK